MRCRRCAAFGDMRWPKSSARPAVGVWRPSSSLSSVVFPAPFGPSSPNTDPFSTVKFTPLTAIRRLPKILVRAVVCRMGIGSCLLVHGASTVISPEEAAIPLTACGDLPRRGTAKWRGRVRYVNFSNVNFEFGGCAPFPSIPGSPPYPPIPGDLLIGAVLRSDGAKSEFASSINLGPRSGFDGRAAGR